MKYPKINSLWKRHEEDHSFIEGDYSRPEFSIIKRWTVQEKIDGMNIRVNFRREHIFDDIVPTGETEWSEPKYYGRSDDSMLPPSLIVQLDLIFRSTKMKSYLNENCIDASNIWFFGEGYGPRIQKGGGNYRKDQSFILFDVVWNGKWSSKEWVIKNAEDLGISYAPYIGVMTEDEIVAYVKSKPQSLCSITPQVMEGIIARPEYPLFLADGQPLMMKLKVRDYEH